RKKERRPRGLFSTFFKENVENFAPSPRPRAAKKKPLLFPTGKAGAHVTKRYLLADEPRVPGGQAGVARAVALHLHVQVVLVPPGGDLPHHGGGVVDVQRFLAGPAVDQKDRLRVVHGEKVFVAEVAGFGPDTGHRAAGDHLLGKAPGAAVLSGVKDMDRDRHTGRLLSCPGAAPVQPAGCGGLVRSTMLATAQVSRAWFTARSCRSPGPRSRPPAGSAWGPRGRRWRRPPAQSCAPARWRDGARGCGRRGDGGPPGCPARCGRRCGGRGCRPGGCPGRSGGGAHRSRSGPPARWSRRSEERRVGKECRCRWLRVDEKRRV